MVYVFVLDRDGNPLMPTTSCGKVRRMLKNGQAEVNGWQGKGWQNGLGPPQRNCWTGSCQDMRSRSG